MAVTKAVGKDVIHAQVIALVESLNAHDVERFVELHTRDAVYTEPGMPAPIVGKPAIRAQMTETFTTFPDLHYPMEDFEIFIAEDGTKAVATWTAMATMRGSMSGFAPTGKSGRMTGACLYEFRGDHIARHTVIYDAMSMAQQFGLLPSTTGLPMRVFAGAQRLTSRVVKLIPGR